MEWYLQKIEEFDDDRPQAFGQHINAAISSQIAATHNLLDSILSLQPKNVVVGDGQTIEEAVFSIIPKI